MLCVVIMKFGSLREIYVSMLADVHKLTYDFSMLVTTMYARNEIVVMKRAYVNYNKFKN